MAHEETSQTAFNTARMEELYHFLGAGVRVTGTSNGSADTEDAFAHTLGRVPKAWLILTNNNGGNLYTGGTADTDALVHIKSTLVSTGFTIYLY